MGYIVKQHNKKTGVTYAYYSEPNWVPGVGPRPKRRLIGRVDPETGEIVPTGRSGPRKKSAGADTDTEVAAENLNPLDQVTELKMELVRAAERIDALESELAAAKSRIRDYAMQMDQIRRLHKTLGVLLSEAGQAPEQMTEQA